MAGAVTGFLLGLGAAGVGAVAGRRIVGFASQQPRDLDGLGPRLDIRTHMKGPMLCEGLIYGPTGRVGARFVADFEGSWDGEIGRISEHFRYDNGSTQDREWRLKFTAPGALIADADDLIGSGTGTQSGPALQLLYRIRMPQSAGGHVLDVTDWLYLMENETIMNRSQFTKFGIKVAELVATIRKT
ncbi:MAG TPA: DUF3833 domain-containing protein [Rhodobacteraceae bacterium]|jgi:hypothetical protein|nr:DUF3833 family protein [Paracoccaceae bacterium]HBG97514.1 DUF3833 domain-containing protein [Paracoccaceae bacterium]